MSLTIILAGIKKLLKKLFGGGPMLRSSRKDSDNKRYTAKNKSIAGEDNSNNQIADTINNNTVQTQPVVMQAPMIGEQARIWFNEQMKAYGCPGDYISFEEQCALSPKFLEEVNIARNEFIKWAQDNSPDGIHLPPYKECNDKAKQLWNEYVKSPKFNKYVDDL